MPGTAGGSGNGGVAGGGNGGNTGQSQGGGTTGTQAGGNGGDGADPFAGLGGAGTVVLTAAERRAALDARLEKSYGTFDGMIISARQGAEGAANSAGSKQGTGKNGKGEQGEGAGNGGAGGTGQDPTILASARTGGLGGGGTGSANGTGGNGTLPAGPAINHTGEYTGQAQAAYPAPPDIPNGNDDDVVARQLREAASHEPDPELREKLWTEYRKYTGLSK